MAKGRTLGKKRFTLILLPQPHSDKYSLGKKNDTEIQMLVLMSMLRDHAVEKMGGQSEDPISIFQVLLPTYCFTICKPFHFPMPHLHCHKNMVYIPTDGNYHIQVLSTFIYFIPSSFRIFFLNGRSTEKHCERPGNALLSLKARSKCS